MSFAIMPVPWCKLHPHLLLSATEWKTCKRNKMTTIFWAWALFPSGQAEDQQVKHSLSYLHVNKSCTCWILVQALPPPTLRIALCCYSGYLKPWISANAAQIPPPHRAHDSLLLVCFSFESKRKKKLPFAKHLQTVLCCPLPVCIVTSTSYSVPLAAVSLGSCCLLPVPMWKEEKNLPFAKCLQIKVASRECDRGVWELQMGETCRYGGVCVWQSPWWGKKMANGGP